MVALLLLRLAIGWHFFQEGAAKLRDGKFSSTGFLSAAKGPLAPMFHNMVWDIDGVYRLNANDTVEIWADYRDRAIDHYGFDTKQKDQANTVFKRHERQLRSYLGSNAEDIREYYSGLDRRDLYRGTAPDMERDQATANRAWREVPSLRGQLNSIESDLAKKRNGWLRVIDALWANYEREINAIATEEQRGDPLALPRVGRQAFDSVAVDKFIPYFDLTIGVLLILGLATRIASIAGAAFLASVVLTQWPLAPDAAPTYYQTVELCGLLVLAGTAAGRFAGLDYLFHAAKMKCCPPKEELGRSGSRQTSDRR